MSKRLKVTAEDTNPSMVYDVVAVVREHPGYLNYTAIARILDEPDITTYYALLYAEQMGYIHGDGGYYVHHGAGGSRVWHFDKLAPYPYEYMDGKRHAYKVWRAVTGKTQYEIGGQYRNGQTWVKAVSMTGLKKIHSKFGADYTSYKTPEPALFGSPQITYKTVAIFDDLREAERWIRRDKKRLENAVNAYYYHKRVLVPSSFNCPRVGA